MTKQEEYERVLEIIADPNNWTDGKWTPVLKGTEHPEILAEQVLKDNK